MGAFFMMDVLISSLVLWVFIFAEGCHLEMRHLWAYVIVNLAVGVSLALPLFLFYRENYIEQLERGSAPAVGR
jgi:hypothetical protein